MELVKNRFKNSNSSSIKTHLTCEVGIVGFYSAKELIKWYGNCECETEYYEKDYGDGEVTVRSYLLIHSNKNYNDEILKERHYGINH